MIDIGKRSEGDDVCWDSYGLDEDCRFGESELEMVGYGTNIKDPDIYMWYVYSITIVMRSTKSHHPSIPTEALQQHHLYHNHTAP